MKKDPRVYLAHILECAQKIERYTKGGEKEFHNDTMLQDAVIRNFEIIGEAAKRVPEAYRKTHSQGSMASDGRFPRRSDTRVRRR